MNPIFNLSVLCGNESKSQLHLFGFVEFFYICANFYMCQYIYICVKQSSFSKRFSNWSIKRYWSWTSVAASTRRHADVAHQIMGRDDLGSFMLSTPKRTNYRYWTSQYFGNSRTNMIRMCTVHIYRNTRQHILQ
jgi:hypothetical protein